MAKILLVDDEAIMRVIISAILKKLGHNVVSCTNVQEAIKKIGDNFDFLLLDFNLPDGTGLTIVEAYKKKGFNIPFIFVTGSTKPDEITLMRNLSPKGIIYKPFTGDEFVKDISAIFAAEVLAAK